MLHCHTRSRNFSGNKPVTLCYVIFFLEVLQGQALLQPWRVVQWQKWSLSNQSSFFSLPKSAFQSKGTEAEIDICHESGRWKDICAFVWHLRNWVLMLFWRIFAFVLCPLGNLYLIACGGVNIQVLLKYSFYLFSPDQSRSIHFTTGSQQCIELHLTKQIKQTVTCTCCLLILMFVPLY